MSRISRRPRGTLHDPVSLGWEVERQAKERLEKLAERAGVSRAVMFEHIMANVEITLQGLPATWSSEPRDGELPIDAAQ